MLFHCPCLPSPHPPIDRYFSSLISFHIFFFKVHFLGFATLSQRRTIFGGGGSFHRARARLALVGIYFRFLVRALYGLLAGLEGSNRKKVIDEK